MRTQTWYVLIALAVAFEATCAHAQSAADDLDLLYETPVPRYALIFANEDYPTQPLRSAAKDADLMQRKLEALQFQVVVERNRSAAQIRAAIDSLRTREVRFARNQDLRPVVLIYFSGHGFEVNEARYLAGIYADTASDRGLKEESVRLRYIEDRLAREAYLIVLVDACRVEMAQNETGLPDAEAGEAAAEEAIPADLTPAGAYDEREEDSPRRIIGHAAWSGDTAAAQQDLDSGEIKPSLYTEALNSALGQNEAWIADELRNAAEYLELNYPERRQYPDANGSVRIMLLNGSNRENETSDHWSEVKAAPTADLMRLHLLRFPESWHAAAARRWMARPRNE